MDDSDQADKLSRVPDLLTEDEVCKRWPQIFGKRALRRARQASEIEFYDLERGPRYSEAQLAQYLERRRKYSKADQKVKVSKSADTGSTMKTSTSRTFATSAEMADAERAAVIHLAQNIGKRPNRR